MAEAPWADVTDDPETLVAFSLAATRADGRRRPDAPRLAPAAPAAWRSSSRFEVPRPHADAPAGVHFDIRDMNERSRIAR